MRGWFDKKGEQSDVVVSTRVRLARNLSDTPFPANWNDETAKAVIEKIKAAAADTPHSFEFLNLDNAPDLNKQALVEEHVMSREMLSGKNKALLLSGDGCVSVMIGEEDDIRLQVIAPGLDLDGVYKTADALDDMLGETLDYAFDEQFGFLTRCPTNVGTGMRASVMLHLPALELAGRMNQLAGEVGKLGLTIRGLYGEGSDSKGSLYQLSNQITLGISEAQTLEKLKNITMQIIETERGMRKRLYERNPGQPVRHAVARAGHTQVREKTDERGVRIAFIRSKARRRYGNHNRYGRAHADKADDCVRTGAHCALRRREYHA